MKTFLYITAGLGLSLGGVASAAPPQKSPQSEKTAAKTLVRALFGTPPAQSTRPDDPDQGDDNAALNAILEVCYKDTPAAERSAICEDEREPVSP